MYPKSLLNVEINSATLIPNQVWLMGVPKKFPSRKKDYGMYTIGPKHLRMFLHAFKFCKIDFLRPWPVMNLESIETPIPCHGGIQ